MPVLNNSRVVLASYPTGLPSIANFRCENTISAELNDGEVLVATRYVSVDTHMRAHEGPERSSDGMLRPGSVIEADGTAEVLLSRHPDFKAGQIVIGSTGWQSHPRLPGAPLRLLPQIGNEEAVSLALLGTAARTAYAGIRSVARLNAGETVVVPAATSPLGIWAGQFARLSGTWTVAIVSSEEECKFAVQTLGFQAAVNRAASNFKEQLNEACVDGIDVCVETLGGALWREIRPLMNEGGRVVLTGTWAQYEHPLSGAADYGSVPTLEAMVRRKLLLGVARPETIDFDDFAADVGREINDGAIRCKIHIEAGLPSAPRAWLSLIDRPGQGMTVVRLGR